MAKKFSELRSTQIPLLGNEQMNQTFIIESYSVTTTELGQKATMITSVGTYATFSHVLIKQLQFMDERNAFPVEVTLRQVKRYYTFE